MCGSTFGIEVQQISLLAVLQSVLFVHGFGQSAAGRQYGWS
jgi:hypothetical protein